MGVVVSLAGWVSRISPGPEVERDVLMSIRVDFATGSSRSRYIKVAITQSPCTHWK